MRRAMTFLSCVLLLGVLVGCGDRPLTSERFYKGVAVGASRDTAVLAAGEPTATFPEPDGSTTLTWTDYKSYKASALISPDGTVTSRTFEAFDRDE